MDDETRTTHIAAFASQDARARELAREALVQAGSQSVPALIEALADDVRTVQVEATRALVSIGDPVAAPAFARALEDNDLDVRWLVSEGLVRLGDDGLRALLLHLTRTTNQHVHDGAILILGRFKKTHGELVAPVLKALRIQTEDSAVMVAADSALARLGRG